MISFEMDLSKVVKDLRKMGDIEDALDAGSKRGLERAVTMWRNRAFKNAPYETGNLAEGIEGEVHGTNINNLVGEITVEAWDEWKGSPFNYAYFIHEVKGKGGVPDPFLEAAYAEIEKRMQKAIEAELLKALEKEGW